MIALTQGQREKLIAHNSEKLKGLKDAVKQTAFESVREELEFEIQSTEVALSALTATPEHHIFKHPLGKLFYSLVDESCKGHDDVYPVYAAPPVPEIKLSLLQSRDLDALIRFNETCEDGDGYDLSKDKMDRLVELGVVRKIKGGIREITALGQMYIDINCQDSPSEFLMTETDRAAAFNQHIKRLNGLGE